MPWINAVSLAAQISFSLPSAVRHRRPPACVGASN